MNARASDVDHRPCERLCGTCKQWKHHSRFRSYRDDRHSTVSAICFRPICRACEQKERNERKNENRAYALIRNRAQDHAHKAGETADFFMTQMNYLALVPVLRSSLSDEGVCLGCGHRFLNERDIQIEHIEPPRHKQDWARLHTRNIRLFCASCNGTKSDAAFAEWLDEQEEARLSNLHGAPVRSKTLPLFDGFDNE